MASCVWNIRAKNRENPLILLKVTIDNVGVPFFETQCISDAAASTTGYMIFGGYRTGAGAYGTGYAASGVQGQSFVLGTLPLVIRDKPPGHQSSPVACPGRIEPWNPG